MGPTVHIAVMATPHINLLIMKLYFKNLSWIDTEPVPFVLNIDILNTEAVKKCKFWVKGIVM
jgi:hypothetical protein